MKIFKKFKILATVVFVLAAASAYAAELYLTKNGDLQTTSGQFLVKTTNVLGGLVNVKSGKTFTNNNTITITATDGTTYTFPTTSATMARTDAAQTFTGLQTIPSLASSNLIEGYTTQATAAGTTTVLATSTYQQYFTGTTTQTVKLPTTAGLTLGQQFQVVNASTGAVTVNSFGSNAITVLAGGTSGVFTCISTSLDTAAGWSATTSSTVVASGKIANFSNSITFAGTDSTTMTFPSTSATMARTDAGQAFTGTNTSTGQLIGTTIEIHCPASVTDTTVLYAPCFTADNNYSVKQAYAVFNGAGTNTNYQIGVEILTGTTAAGSGTAIVNPLFPINTTSGTNFGVQTGTMTATATTLSTGNRLGLTIVTPMTSSTGVSIDITLVRTAP